VTDERRRTLDTLLALYGRIDNTGCWDRAEVLLRAHYSPDELREAGADRAIIARIFPEVREE
jgi:hypothetical protein